MKFIEGGTYTIFVLLLHLYCPFFQNFLGRGHTRYSYRQQWDGCETLKLVLSRFGIRKLRRLSVERIWCEAESLRSEDGKSEREIFSFFYKCKTKTTKITTTTTITRKVKANFLQMWNRKHSILRQDLNPGHHGYHNTRLIKVFYLSIYFFNCFVLTTFNFLKTVVASTGCLQGGLGFELTTFLT